MARLLGSVFVMCLGGAYFWWGGMPSTETADLNGATPFHIFGLLIICSGLFGVIVALMKLRAPVPLSERAPVGSETISFDADAAIERYMAQKRSTIEPFPAKTVPDASRPVFGRKTTAD